MFLVASTFGEIIDSFAWFFINISPIFLLGLTYNFLDVGELENCTDL